MIECKKKTGIIRFDILMFLWYNIFDEEIQRGPNRESSLQGENYPSLAWWREVIYSDEGKQGGVESGTMVEFEEAVSRRRLLGVDRPASWWKAPEGDRTNKGIYKGTEAVFSGGNVQGVAGIYKTQVWAEHKYEVVEADRKRDRREISSWPSSNRKERL